MRYIHLLIFVLFIYLPVKGQITSGEIIYKIKMTEDFSRFQDTTNNKEHLKRFWLKRYNNLKTSVPFINHKVSFTKTHAISHTKGAMNIDNGYGLERAKMATFTDNLYYFNFNERTSIQQFKNFGTTYRIIRYPDSLNWNIQDEYKEIKGYTCQKATTKYSFNHLVKNKIIVWFAPELPLFIGPIGIAGVPGAILEFEKEGLIFYADKINLSHKEVKINPPSKGKLITTKEYREIIFKNDPRAKEFMEKKVKGEL